MRGRLTVSFTLLPPSTWLEISVSSARGRTPFARATSKRILRASSLRPLAARKCGDSCIWLRGPGSKQERHCHRVPQPESARPCQGEARRLDTHDAK